MGVKRGAAVAGILLLAAVIGGVLGNRSGDPAPDAFLTRIESIPETSLPGLVVHVAGWVAHPGVVEVPMGSLVADAIAQAGGARAGAQIDSINLARKVAEGDRIEVPGPDDEVVETSADGNQMISLNRSDATALQQLPGVGPVLADRIVAFREANGPFERVEDLLDVPGIGEAKLASIRDLITVP